MTELLVFLACAQNAGCTETTNAYYLDHPEMKQIVRQQTAKLKRVVGPEMVMLSPFILAAAKGHGTFSLTKHFSVRLSSKDSNMLIFSVSY